MKTILLAGAIALTACTTEPAIPDLASDHIEADVYMYKALNNVSLSLWNQNGGTCLHIAEGTRLTVNGLKGQLVDSGAEAPYGRCTPAVLELDIKPLPESVDLVVDDGTTQLRVNVVTDLFGQYKITDCTAQACNVFE